jgi:glycosyltransferase involved in cell wall biosynthesis
MKITYIITRGDEYYGAQKYVFDQASHFAKENEVTVITGQHGILNEKLTKIGIRNLSIKQITKSISPIKDLFAIIRLFFVIRKINPDIISVHSSKTGILVRILNPFIKAKIVFTAHGWSFTAGDSRIAKKMYGFIEYFFQFFCAMIIVESEKNKKIGITNKIKAEKITVIDSGVVKRTTIHKIEEKYANLTSSEYILKVITIAGFRPQKDYQNMLNSILYYTSNVNKNIEFYIYGDGPQREFFEKKVKESGAKNIHFMGEYDNAEEAFENAHVLLLLSYYEGLPLAILEALSFGLPVICSNVGGNADAVKDDYNGYLIKNNIEYDYISKCLNSYTNSKILKDFSVNSFKKWESNFNIEKTHNNIFILFQNI